MLLLVSQYRVNLVPRVKTLLPIRVEEERTLGMRLVYGFIILPAKVTLLLTSQNYNHLLISHVMWDYIIVEKLIKPYYNIMQTMIIYIQ